MTETDRVVSIEVTQADCDLCAKLPPDMEQSAARTAAQIGGVMQCRECGRVYETSAVLIATNGAKIQQAVAAEVAQIVAWLRGGAGIGASLAHPSVLEAIERGEYKETAGE